MKSSLRIAGFLLVFAAITARLPAQSTSDAVSRLEKNLQTISAEFATQLKSTAENPDLLLRAEIKGATVKALSDLDSLAKEIDEAAVLISSKEAKISSGKLPQSDKTELLSSLGKQKKPLITVREKISQVRKKIQQIDSSELSNWNQTFSAFESIKGRESAMEKLSGAIKASIAPVPLLAEPFAKPGRSSPTHVAGDANPTIKSSASSKLDETLQTASQNLKNKVTQASPTPAQAERSTSGEKSIETSESPSFSQLLGAGSVALLWIVFLFTAGANCTGAGSIGNIFCALNSLSLPGLGQIGQRRIFPGILFMVAGGALWAVYMGWVIHLWAAVNAARWKPEVKPA